jgi:hypothetical protein
MAAQYSIKFIVRLATHRVRNMHGIDQLCCNVDVVNLHLTKLQTEGGADTRRGGRGVWKGNVKRL